MVSPANGQPTSKRAIVEETENDEANVAQINGNPVDEAALSEAIKQLSSPIYARREAASLVLWKAGEPAEPLLRSHLFESKNPEVVKHCRRILGMFELGIYPDTPPETIAAIKRFAKSDLNAKTLIIRQLLNKKMALQAIRLVASSSLRDRARLDQQVMPGIGAAIDEEIIAGEFESAKTLLAFAADVGPNQNSYYRFGRDFAVFIALTGDLDKQIALEKRRPKSMYPESRDRMLTNLLAIKGDLKSAQVSALKLSKSSGYRINLLNDIYLRQQNWLAITNDDSIMKRTKGYSGQTGLAAAYYRLANNPQKFEREIDEVRQRLIESPNTAFYCTEAFMINHKWEEAIETAKLYSIPFAFDLLCHRSQFEEAFELIDFQHTKEKNAAAKWLTKIDERESGKKNSAWKTKLYTPKGIDATYITEQIAGKLAWQLHRLGEKEQARLLLEAMLTTSGEQQPRRITKFIETSLRCGYEQWATKIANQQLKGPKNYRARQTLLKFFFPEQSLLAVDLAELILVDPELFSVDLESAQPKFIQQIRKRIQPKDSELLTIGQLKKINDEHNKRFFNKSTLQTTKSTILKNQAELAKIHQKTKLAIQQLKRAIEATPKHSLYLKLGDWYGELGEWKLASEQYRTAFEKADRSYTQYYIGERSLAAYLEGLALQKMGNFKEGEERIKLAELLPLSKTNARQQLAKGLMARGLTDAANRNFISAFNYCTINMSDWWLHRVNSSAGNAVKKHDGLKAASIWELSVLHLTSNSSKYNDILGYSRELMLVHQKRGNELMKAGNPKLAAEEFRTCIKIGNQGSNSHIGLIKALRELDRDEESEAQFQKSFDRYSKILAMFPDSSHHNNNLAWICVSLGQELKLAERLANKAVNAEPETPSFLDTMASIHEAQGRLKQAIEVQKKAVQFADDKTDFEAKLHQLENRLKQQNAEGK